MSAVARSASLGWRRPASAAAPAPAHPAGAAARAPGER